MIYFYAFLFGGLVCAFSQILIDRTSLTPAKILSLYVVIGIAMTAVGLYEPLVKWAGAGATVPILGFGYAMASGVKQAVLSQGLLGAFTGGLGAAAGGVAAAVAFSFLAAVIFKAGDKS